jgi:hypothetical protein
MAFSVDDISASHDAATARESLRSPYAKAGLEYAENPGRQTFKRITCRYIPDFTVNDFELRIVVAQTAYTHFRSSLPWKRIPEEMIVDPPALTRLIAERLEKKSISRPDFLSRFNTTKDYVACLSAVAYLKWRTGLHNDEIATYLQIPVDVVARLAWRLRCNARRLGMPVKCWVPPKGPSRSESARKAYENKPALRQLAREHGKKVCQKRWSRPGEKERHSAAIKTAWSQNAERRAAASARAKAMNLKRFLKTVAWA